MVISVQLFNLRLKLKRKSHSTLALAFAFVVAALFFILNASFIINFVMYI